MATSRVHHNPSTRSVKAPMTAPNTPQPKFEKFPMSAPCTPATKFEKLPMCSPGSFRANEEKIYVTVRVRPLSKKEEAAKDQVAWECVDDNTILFRSSTPDRSSSTSMSTFDRVFGPTCLTETVYEEGAKDVALSALTGINATIFAYGQTSSGKTYTMRGITECVINDIYKHIMNTPEQDFVIKVSAIEIYNEIVHDLLNPDSGPLRLLDDPEKGTIVDKLEEQTAIDDQHLHQLIGICEAKRQVGETALNDTSSRSHQIIRLTIESRLQENSGCVKSFVANLNLVDLAGSERVSQTHADGARLKEGSHINRSLLTLTTVIRKLSVGRRGGHIPYRDSKLTRILQHSLGGNARTAIICTMSPALTHVEQSRNTLCFAARAKEITNTAQVNMVVSDKQLVKHLQKEVARLEAELRTPEVSTPNTEALLLEKELKIRKMEMEMEELKQERDQAKAQLEKLQKKVPDDPIGSNLCETSPHRVAKCLTFSGKPTEKRTRNAMRQSSTTPTVLMQEIRKLEQLQNELGGEANRAIEVLQKEVACHRLGNQDAAETIAKLQAEIKEMCTLRPSAKEVEVGNLDFINLKQEITRLHSQGNSISILEQKLENVQKSLDRLVMSLPNSVQTDTNTAKSTNKTPSKKKKMLPLNISNNINRSNILKSPCSPRSSTKHALESDIENKAPEDSRILKEKSTNTSTVINHEDGSDVSSRDSTPRHRKSTSSVNIKKMQKMFQNAAEENVRSIKAYVTELKERVAKLQYQKQLLVCQVLELEANEASENDESDNEENTSETQKSPHIWHHYTFNNQMKEIIELWDRCYVSIIHRTQFYLLFRGDPADQIYVEVEHRRLKWLEKHLSEVGTSSSPAHNGEDSIVSLSSSIKALRQEREFLAKRVNSRLTEEERERVYMKWDIPLEGKQRKLQLLNKLWTDTNDKAHIEASADTVARLVGFCEGGNVTKEMFELNFSNPANKRPWIFGWQPISNLLGL